MAPKKSAAASAAAATATASTEKQPATPTTPSASAKRSSTTKSGATSWDVVFQNIYTHYLKETTQRTKLIDVFLAFLVVVGALQFAYCVLAGNYPFNAFLSGFSATVGQFVLAISLRIQTATTDKSEFPSVSPERAFADFIVCSLILHFFCINFIN